MNELDTPINRATIAQMTDDQIDAHLDQLRERRLKPIQVYKEAKELADKLKHEKRAEALEKAIEGFEKDLLQFDKKLEKLQSRALKIRGIRLEMSMED